MRTIKHGERKVLPSKHKEREIKETKRTSVSPKSQIDQDMSRYIRINAADKNTIKEVLPQTSKSKEIKIKIKAIIRTPVSPKYILPKSRIDQDKSRENGRDMNPVKIKINTHRKRKINKEYEISLKKAKKKQNYDNVHTTVEHNTPFISATYQYPSFIENLNQIPSSNDNIVGTTAGLIPNVGIKQEENMEPCSNHQNINTEPQIDIEKDDKYNSFSSVKESLRKINSLV